MLVGKQLGTKKTFKRNNIEPWWKRRIENDIKYENFGKRKTRKLK